MKPQERTSKLTLFFFLLYVSCVFLRPWELFDNSPALNAIPITLLGLALLSWLLGKWTGALQSQFKLDLFWNSTCTCGVLLFFWVFLSTFKRDDPILIQGILFDSLFKGILLFLVIPQIIRSPSDFRTLILTLPFAVLGTTLLALIHSTTGDPSARLQYAGMLADPNDLAALIVMTLPIGLRRFKSPFNLLLLLLDCYAIWKTSSRGAILALGITLAFYFVVRIEGYTKKALTIAVLVLLVTRISAGLGRESDDLEQSTSSRLNYWKAGINMVMHQPILGVGFMNYPHEFERYAPEIEYEWGERTAHSSWILIMAETGLLGLGLFAAVYYQVLRKAWNLKAIYPELFYSALAYGSAMTFLSHCYTLYPWFISGLIMAGGKTVESHDGQRS